MSAPIYFHVGLHKSGSTFLQNYFTWEKRIHHVTPRANWKLFAVGNAFNFNHAAARKYVAEHTSAADDKPTVFSHERLSGNTLNGYFDQKEIADRLHAVVPEARILLVVREQYSFIASSYRQYIKVGGTRLFIDFINPTRDGRAPLFDARPLRYVDYVVYLRKLFGPDRVLVLPFELLKADATDFLHRVGGLLGLEPVEFPDELLVPRNVGLEDEKLDEARFRNLHYVKKRSFRDPIFSNLDQFLDDGSAASIIGRNTFLECRSLGDEARLRYPGLYKESNAALSKLIGFDLGRLGYDV